MTIRAFCKILFLSSLTLSTAACANTPTKHEADYKAFAAEMEKKHQIPATEVEELLAGTEFRDDIIAAITRPAEGKPWFEYRPIFLQPDRIQGGVKFWQENAELLDRISREYGVPPEIIVAIIGVETRYGQHTGRYRVLDALATLAFGYPKRADFFRAELEQFLVLSREESVDPRAALGSYAGAMGKPQFISSSYRRYAVDGDGDGRRDLWQSNADVIASVANYFKLHGWQAGELITLPTEYDGIKYLQPFVDAGMKPSIPLSDLQTNGVKPAGNTALASDTLCSLIQLDMGAQYEYWLGLQNFYVITRYNHSNLYAMAAYQLSQEILAAKQAAEAVSR
jgi:membrane-bound lytic murein transglycosylase B